MTTTSSSLTQSQMMIWMGQQMSPSEPLYNMILTFEIKGRINLSIFEKAFQELVNQNDVLRCSFGTKNNIPFQIFQEKVDSPLQIIDFSMLSNPYESYLEWVENNKGKLFDLGELMYHAVIFQITAEKFIFYFNQHHLITDGWSVKYLYEELNKNYQSLLNSKNMDRTIGSSFEAYADKNSFQNLVDTTPYWDKKLKNKTELPTLYFNKASQIDTRSNRINFSLGKERTQKLKELTQDPAIRAWTIELALSNIFLTAMAALISKVGNQESFTIGVPYHNRLNTTQRKTAGLFMELLPMQVLVEQEENLVSLLQKIKEESLEVIKNTMVAKPPSDLLRTFNVLMNFVPATFGNFDGLPIESHWLLADHVDPNHHVRLQIQDFDQNEDYKLQFDFNVNLFSKQQMHRIGQHYIRIIDAFVNERDKKIGEIDIITEDELKSITNWNQTTLAYDQTETLLSKFELQVAKTPNNIALLYENETMTYSELHHKSNQVAQFLKQKGLRQNEIVAISFQRSFEMMVYIYGILKSGAAYLPIDAEIPIERLNFILQDAEVNTFFINHNKGNDWSLANVNLYSLQEITGEVSKLPIDDVLVEVLPNDLAYIIYTSGSTGNPKGVRCHHKGICNRLNWMNDDYPINQEDVLLQKTPITFDVSLWELFWPLQVGSKLVVASPEEHKNPEKLIETIVENGITNVHFVPSMLNVFMETSGVNHCTGLNRIFCSGEALSVSTVRKVFELLETEVHNLYGPTEAAVDVTSWQCTKENVADGIPIGYPVANTRIYILDSGVNQVPVGVAGELYIAGVQVAHGYLNNDELSDVHFLEDIFSEDSNDKMYRTGDLARYREDGAIMYLGRVDNQIKLRGLRIELGEIEKTMEKHQAVSQAVVSVSKVFENQEVLVAYYTGSNLEEIEITRFLEKLLPLYMVPSRFVHLEEFKFLSSGKVNRKALSKLSAVEVKEVKSYVAPTNEFEEIIADAWREVMKMDRVGIDENFIHLGGNSLNAIFITSRLKTEFEMDLSITLVFTYPTIRLYAAYIEKLIIELLSE